METSNTHWKLISLTTFAVSAPVRFVLCALAALLIPLFATSIARAQAPRTYVSADKGNDAKKCTSDQPCRTFTKALTEVAPGGEVVALDSGNYEPFAIAKSVTVQAAPGVYAGITVKADPAGIGVNINAGPSDAIVLRGLTLNSLGGHFGISFDSGGTVHIENCVVNGFRSVGIVSQAVGETLIKDTTIRNTAGTAILVNGDAAGAGIVKVAIDHCRLEKNGNGIFVSGHARVAIRDSLIVASRAGINSDLPSSDAGPRQTAPAEVMIENCLVTHNEVGIFSFGAIIRVSNSTISSNDFGLLLGPASAGLLSRGNNTLEGNGVDGSFSGSFAAK